MFLTRLRAVSAALLPLVLLAACSSTGTDVPPPGVLDAITVAGTDTAPTVTFKTKPLSVTATTTKVVTAGKGAKLVKANSITFNYSLFNAKDGTQIETSFGKGTVPLDLSSTGLMKGLGKGLTGQLVGSRLLVAIPPADAFGAEGNAEAGVGPTDTIVFLIDVISAITPLATATGASVPPKAGLPTAVVDGAKAAVITVPKTAPPTKLVVQPLIKGSGAVVKSGQTIKVSYTGVLWKDGKKFDASSDHGSPVDIQIGTGKVIPGWDKGLVDQTVGSRILLVVPPADGYGTRGSPPIGPKDTMVFVVDILAAT
ncbi:MAG TPA: FKBP-type peptidyl-prolyl cis-trans isomerase [Nocardioidaceae bacterium]|nr:FKBP-type peptidyl-prolyl cis-trans isomerase [Nocardioidaceae bacterium]